VKIAGRERVALVPRLCLAASSLLRIAL
jgi:hypothetical protein